MNVHRSHRKIMDFSTLIIFLSLLVVTSGSVQMAQAAAGEANILGFDPTVQSQNLLYDEARTVYLGNLARRDNGFPPLRWNRQLTHAARWFSWDSTENRDYIFCGHQDTQGNWPDYRTLASGYPGSYGGENAYCGYVSPETAIAGWMNSPGHRANLLDPDPREIGVGYYRRDIDGRGYITQDFGYDAGYAPVIVENEAVSTTSPDVNLYIYDRMPVAGFAGFSPATQMMVSNSDSFPGAVWEPYKAGKAWSLTEGEGWRSVYVKTRDIFNRSLTVSDAIYLGTDVPLDQLGTDQMSTTESGVTLYDLDGGPLPQVQFSLGWLADDSYGSFTKWWGNGEHVNDTAAWGGTSYRLYPGSGESFAWVWDTTFIKDTPMVAYFRLKVNDNTSTSEVARISVRGGGTDYGPLSLRGTDFITSGQYQEFPISFTFNSNPDDGFLSFYFWRSGTADVYVDAVSIFSESQPVTSPLTWSVPGDPYRGQGVWVRYTDGSRFSDISDGAITEASSISGNAGLAGAVLSYNDGSDKTIAADGNGKYSILVPEGWSGTVTPSHLCYIFTPGSRTYDNVTGKVTDEDYAAVPSGRCDSSTSSSIGAADGWVLETKETGGMGGTLNRTATAFHLGDDAANKQYRSILSFDTSRLPDDAVITGVTLKIKKAGLVGTDPFNTHGNLLVDVRKGAFSGNAGLQIGDFQAQAGKNAVMTIPNNPVNGWYIRSMTAANFIQINKTGITQFRLRFAKDDNNDLNADFLKFYSGNASVAASRPQLIIKYYLP